MGIKRESNDRFLEYDPRFCVFDVREDIAIAALKLERFE